MPPSGSIRAGRAFVELFADDSKLVRGLRRAERRLRAFGDSIRNFGLKLTALGSAMLAPLVASAKLFSGYGDQVAKMAKRTGLSVETLSELRFVATQTGTEFESLEMAFRKMQRSIYDAGRGLSTPVDALGDLGLTFADLDGLSPEEQFKLLADRISMIEDPTRKAAIAMTLFGRTGTNLLPMFASGARGIEVLQAEARRLGLTMSGEDAAAAEEFTDALDRLWKVVKMGVFHVGAALAPTLQKVADTITALSVQVSAWMNENRAVIATVLKVVVAIIAVGVAITLLGTTISIFAGVLGAFITVITTVVLVIKTLGAVLLFLVSPIGIVIAAVAGLAAYLIYATDAGAKALSWLGQKFMVLKDDALKAYQGIADALAAGDIGLAVKVLWLTIKMEWTRGTNFLEKMWLGFRGFFIQIGYDAWHGLLAIAEIVWHALEVGWIETTAFFAKAWQGFVGFFAATWERIKAGAKKAWNWIKSLFDDSIDLQAENRLVEDQKNAAISQIEDDQQRRIAEREAQRQRERQRAAAIHEQTLAGIGQENLDSHQALEDEYAQRMSENEQDLQQAREEWQRAVDDARQKREQKESEDAGPGQLEDPDAIIDRARDALEGIGDVVDAEVAKVGVRGTFYAAGARGLSTGNAADRTAKATEETAKNTKRLAQAAVAGGVTFA
jgi:uncharacterized membrane protein YkgB